MMGLGILLIVGSILALLLAILAGANMPIPDNAGIKSVGIGCIIAFVIGVCLIVVSCSV